MSGCGTNACMDVLSDCIMHGRLPARANAPYRATSGPLRATLRTIAGHCGPLRATSRAPLLSEPPHRGTAHSPRVLVLMHKACVPFIKAGSRAPRRIIQTVRTRMQAHVAHVARQRRHPAAISSQSHSPRACAGRCSMPVEPARWRPLRPFPPFPRT